MLSSRLPKHTNSLYTKAHPSSCSNVELGARHSEPGFASYTTTQNTSACKAPSYLGLHSSARLVASMIWAGVIFAARRSRSFAISAGVVSTRKRWRSLAANSMFSASGSHWCAAASVNHMYAWTRPPPQDLKTIARTGEAAKLPFPIHPHMLRHSTGYKLANDGHDTRALQHCMGHKNIMHTVRYTEMAPDRFKNFWKD